MLCLIVLNAIHQDNEWRRLYERLTPLKCAYDERSHAYKGKGKVMGRIAGQITEMIFVLLKTDQELLGRIPPGTLVPAPMLYDPDIHRVHRQGVYRPLKPGRPADAIALIPSSSPLAE